MFQKIKQFTSQHKIATGFLVLAIGLGSYFGYKKLSGGSSATHYVLAAVQQGTIVTSVSGSGQVSASNQIDIKPKASGDVVYVGVKNGQEVKAGTLIAQLDARDAQKAVRDAEVNLESARLSFEKLNKPADTLSILQAENSLAQAKESKQKAEDDLNKAYDDGFNTIANAMLDLPGIMTGLEDMMFDNTIDPGSSGGDNITWYVNQTNYQTDAREKAIRYMNDVYNTYNHAREVYDKNFDDYKATSRTADQVTIEALILQTYDTTKIIADTIKTIDNFIDFVQDDMEKRDYNIPAMVLTHQTNISSYTSKTNSHLLNLLAIKRTIEDSKNAIVNADRSIAEKTESLAKLKAGADALDVQSAELAVKQRENALLDAKEKLADYFVRAPFDGIIATLDVKKGDTVSSATVLGTLITKQKIAEISLNEVDVAKVKVGQKATLTFDAAPDLSIAGEVSEIDTLGTISQGVVSYTVKIVFGTQNEQVRPGMSVSADIIIDVKQNALLIPNSAVKSAGGANYVEVPQDTAAASRLLASVANSATGVELNSAPRRQAVEIGLSNDSVSEVISGLKEGDLVIARTITSANQTQPTQTRSIFGGSGGGSTRSGIPLR
jgi:HlyD family secretion protein